MSSGWQYALIKLPEPYKVLMCGDRNWAKTEVIRRELRKLKKNHGNDLIIITGGAPGADKTAEIVAKQENVHVAVVGALWETRGRSAGPQRNQVMLSLGPDEVIAFHENIKESRGTKDMIARADRVGCPTTLVAS